jgi:hypothetical protein
MEDLIKIKTWIEAGKQIGKRCWLEENGKKYWVSVGVQKWQDIYKIYFDKIEESHMQDYDHYDTEEIIKVNCFEKIQTTINSKFPINLIELTPQKGQKIFSPEYD